MKKTLLILIFNFVFLLDLIAQPWPIDQAEILIENNLSHLVYVKVYPIGSIYSGWFPNFNLDHKYSLQRSNPAALCHWQNPINDTLYISGGTKVIGANNFGVLDFDDHNYFHRIEYNDRVIGGFSFGLWKFEFYYTPDAQTPEENIDLIADCKIDYRDFNYGLDGTPLGYTKDIYLFLENDSNSNFTNLNFQFVGGNVVSINDTLIFDKTIKWWHQVGRTNSQGNNPFHPGSPNRGLFKSISSFTKYPVYATEYGASKHLNPGDIDLNLKIVHDIYTRDTLIDSITNITVKKKAFMQLDTGVTFNMITPIFGYNNLIVEDSATLVLENNSKIIIENENKVTLKNLSNLTFRSSSLIHIKQGGSFCNEGGKIRGNGTIYFDKGLHSVCPGIDNITKVEDSTKIVLEDSAIVIFPDDYNLHLRGNTTSLIMKPGSKVMFGENSGIVCDSGAKLIANSAVFTSFDSTKKWSGISLKHRSQDTIKNCVIKNADFGINIMNKNDDEETEIPYSTEISGCSFINQTSHVLNNAIYAAGSSKLLISNNV